MNSLGWFQFWNTLKASSLPAEIRRNAVVEDLQQIEEI